MSILDRLVPGTMRGQITVIIIVAVVAVMALGRITGPLRSGYLAAWDMRTITDRVVLMAELLSETAPGERRALLKRASGADLDLMLMDRGSFRTMVSSSPSRHPLDRGIAWLFPTDADLPPGGQRIIIAGRQALSLPVDDNATLVARNLPSMIATTNFLNPLTYYILAFLTLLLFFSTYAVRVVTRPLARIVDELDRTDGVAEERQIAEGRTVEVAKLAQALNGMRTRIRDMVDMRMRMLRGVSHDLRTPLTQLRLRAERVDDETLRHAMIGDIDRIDVLITDTLDYLRTDSSAEKDEPVDIASLVQTIRAEFSDVRYDGPGIPRDKRALVMEPFLKLDEARGKPGAAGVRPWALHRRGHRSRGWRNGRIP